MRDICPKAMLYRLAVLVVMPMRWARRVHIILKISKEIYKNFSISFENLIIFFMILIFEGSIVNNKGKHDLN